ncbi:setd6 [Symbiodinium necroappetens]|uniref:Setd6 protein n=1 Tax=Symbiodinium necroappetens TaxID=1628268 RepID=A0A812RXY7_9DINO|nr:setd6 [Symbiodinium necroappetens]
MATCLRIAKLPDVEGLEDGKRSLTGEVIATGMELSLPKTKGKAGKNKRWLKGRGAAKRRKLEENSRLEKWLETNGVWVSETAAWGQPAAGVSMAVETREQTENEVSGRGLVARRDIEQYEDLARVPKPLLLTKESSCGVFGEECIPADMSEYPAIALHLIYEKFVKKEESFWAPYIAVLPSTDEVGASFSWEDEELDTLLNGSICRNMSLYLKEQVRDEFNGHQATIFTQFPEKFPADAFTYENYVAASECNSAQGSQLRISLGVMSCDSCDIAFAVARLGVIAAMGETRLDDVVDRWLEGPRHALIHLHSCLDAESADRLLPLMDLLTSLHLGSDVPVATGVLEARGGSVGDFEDLYQDDFSLLLRSSLQIRILLAPRPSGPRVAAIFLSKLFREVGQVCGSMASAAVLWETLRLRGLQDIAPVFVECGVYSVELLHERWDALLRRGVARWQLEFLSAGVEPSRQLSLGGDRQDLPPVRKRKRASLQEALAAAAPDQRQQALRELEGEVLAKSTVGPMESRLAVWKRICLAWDVAPFPLDIQNVRMVGASLKRGGYRSAAQYYAAATSWQQRQLHTPVPQAVRFTIRDCVRSIRRGLGPAELKDSFPVSALAKLVDEASDVYAFDFESPAAAADAMLVGSYYMLREIEMANARSEHLYFKDGLLQMLIPVHKTSTEGELTVRSLACCCQVRRQPLCPWHAGQRHLQRLQILQGVLDKTRIPLFPDTSGRVLSKHQIVDHMRNCISLAGISVTRPDEVGLQVQRFGGHVLRVSGAQHLSLLGLSVEQIQLQGRWASDTVRRYVQSAPLLHVPGLVAEALTVGPRSGRGWQIVEDPGQSTEVIAVEADEEESQSQGSVREKDSGAQIAALRAEFAVFRSEFATRRMLVVNRRMMRPRGTYHPIAAAQNPPAGEGQREDHFISDSVEDQNRRPINGSVTPDGAWRGRSFRWGQLAVPEIDYVTEAVWEAKREVADRAGASPEILRYLELRGIKAVGTLAHAAASDTEYRDVVIRPLLAGFGPPDARIEISEQEKPIASAILMYMRNISLEAQRPQSSQPKPSGTVDPDVPATSAGTSGSRGASASSYDPDKVPKTLPAGVWTQQIQKWESVVIHGVARKFPEQRVIGAESSLAKRSFDSAGLVNGLAKRKVNQELVIDIDKDRLLTKDDAEGTFEPRSMLAVIDALNANRWALLLLEYGPEHEIDRLYDLLEQRARQRPQNLEQFRVYYEAAMWNLCMSLRAGKTFAEAAAGVREDVHQYQEVMARPTQPLKKEPPPKKLRTEDGKQQDTPQGWSDNKKGKGKRPFDPGGHAPPGTSSQAGRSSGCDAAPIQHSATGPGQGEMGPPPPVSSGQSPRPLGPHTVAHHSFPPPPPPAVDRASSGNQHVIHLDFFAGMGTASLALRHLGYSLRAVFAWEVDPAAIKVASQRCGDGYRHMGDVLQADPAWIAAQVAAIPGGNEDIIVITVAAPCPDYSQVRSESSPGRSGRSGALFVQFCGILDKLLGALKGRKVTLVAENVVMNNPADIQWFSKRLDAGPMVVDSSDFAAVSRPRLWWTWVDWSVCRAHPANSKPLRWRKVQKNLFQLHLDLPKQDPSDLQVRGLKLHPKVLDGSRKLPCLTTPAQSEAGRDPPKAIKGRIDSATRARWLEHRRSYAPWFFLEENMMTDPHGTMVLLPIEAKELAHQFVAGFTQVEGVTDKERHTLLGNSWHFGVSLAVMELALHHGVRTVGSATTERAEDLSKVCGLASVLALCSQFPLSLSKIPEWSSHVDMQPPDDMWQHWVYSERAVHPLAQAPAVDPGIHVTMSRLLKMGPRIVEFRTRVLSEVRSLAESMRAETQAWFEQLKPHIQKAYTLPDGHIVQIIAGTSVAPRTAAADTRVETPFGYYVHNKLTRGRVDPEWEPMLQEILSEVRMGRMRGPFASPDDWPKACVPVAGVVGFTECKPLEGERVFAAGAFSVVQQGSDGSKKVRRCEDYRRSYHNATICTADVPAHDTVETYVQIIRMLIMLGYWVLLWCQDLWAAYRQFPLSHPSEAYTFLGTPAGPTLWQHAVLPFGASSSVWCFNRCIDALMFLGRSLLFVLVIHFVDDIGVLIEIAGDGIWLCPEPGRVRKVLMTIREALLTDTLTPETAQKLAGKLVFLGTTLFGRIGAASLHPVYSRSRDVSGTAPYQLNSALRCALEVLQRMLHNSKPRWIPFWSPHMPHATLYADAFFSAGETQYGLSSEPPAAWNPQHARSFHNGAGFVVRTGTLVRYAHWEVPAALLQRFSSCKAFIYALEIMAQIVAAITTWRDLPVLWVGFCDNSAGRAALSRGYSKETSLNHLLAFFWSVAAALQWCPQLEWVQSEFNIADPFSRGDVSIGVNRRWQALQSSLDPLWDVFYRVSWDLEYATGQAVSDALALGWSFY